MVRFALSGGGWWIAAWAMLLLGGIVVRGIGTDGALAAAGVESSMQLTPHFSLRELTFSATAARQGLANLPDPSEIDYIRHTAQRMEQVRRLLGDVPITVLSATAASWSTKSSVARPPALTAMDWLVTLSCQNSASRWPSRKLMNMMLSRALAPLNVVRPDAYGRACPVLPATGSAVWAMRGGKGGAGADRAAGMKRRCRCSAYGSLGLERPPQR